MTDDMRAAVKAVTYAQLYGAGPKSVAQSSGLPEADVRRVIESFQRSYPRVSSYFADVYRDCRKNGYVQTLSGRRRFLPEIRSTDPKKAAAAKRKATNSTVQGSAADLIKQAMLQIDERLTPSHGPCALHSSKHAGRLLLQIHDELIFEVESGRVEELQRLVRHAMQEAHGMELRVPLLVQIKVGPSWGELQKVEEVEVQASQG